MLSSNLSKEEKKTTLIRIQQQLANAAKLVIRAYRFYEWLPHEIHGKHDALHYFIEEIIPEKKIENGRWLLPYFNYGG